MKNITIISWTILKYYNIFILCNSANEKASESVKHFTAHTTDMKVFRQYGEKIAIILDHK